MDHVTESLNRLLYQYREAANIQSLIVALAQQSQDEEDALQDIIVKEMFDYAVGEQLDAWGAILNVQRGVMNDYDYRTRLRIKIAQMNSEGTITDLISIFQQMTNAAKVTLVELFPATIALSAFSGSVTPEALINLKEESPVDHALIEVANSGGWGVVTSKTIYSNVTTHPLLKVEITALTSSTVVIGITDITDPETPTFYRLNPVSISATGTYEYNIPTITGLSGNRKYYVNLIVEALITDSAEFGFLKISNLAEDDFDLDEDFDIGTAGTRPDGWFDSRGGIGPLYDFTSIREAIEVSKCAGVGIDSLSYDTELPAFAFDGFSLGDYPLAGFDDGTESVGGFLATGF